MQPTAIDPTGYNETTEDRELFLDAVLYPHRSLGKTGFLILMAAICGCSFVVGLVFFLVGAWPVIGFLGLDVLIVYIAFRLNYRAARAYETVRLSRSAFEVTHVDPKGHGRQTVLNPSWLSVDMDDPPHRKSRLIVRTHGRRLELGRFLTPAEKLDFARTLRRALSAARAAIFPTAQA